jgi:uncharacterized protein YktB (UPF0637 family)
VKAKKAKGKKEFSEFIREEEDDQFELMMERTKKVKRGELAD